MSLKHKKRFLWLRENLLLILILIGVVLGFLVGVFVNKNVQDSTDPSPTEIAMLISFPGELFVRMLKLLILPLIVSSVIVSLAILDRKLMAKLGKRAAAYFFITTLIAVTLGVILSSVLKPGITKSKADGQKTEWPKEKNAKAIHAIFDLIRNILPDNIVEAATRSTATKLTKKVPSRGFDDKSAENFKAPPRTSLFLERKATTLSNTSSGTTDFIQDVAYEYNGLEKYDSPNILGILFFSVFFGAILSMFGEEGKPMIQWFNCLFKVTMKMVEIFMWFSPIGICSIIAGEIAAMKNVQGSVESLGMYIITMIVACLFHSLVILPTIYFLMLRKNPFYFLAGVAKALLTAFGTASASATLPVTLTCLEKNHKVDQRVAQFVLPIGVIVNKDGMGIYNAVAAMYIAQIHHEGPLDFTLTILVGFASILSSVAAATIPASGPIVTSTIVLQAIGIRSADMGLIFAIDWFLDRLITSVNLWGNCVGSVIVEHLSREDLILLVSEKEDSAPPSSCTVDFKTDVSVEIEIGKETNENHIPASDSETGSG